MSNATLQSSQSSGSMYMLPEVWEDSMFPKFGQRVHAARTLGGLSRRPVILKETSAVDAHAVQTIIQMSHQDRVPPRSWIWIAQPARGLGEPARQAMFLDGVCYDDHTRPISQCRVQNYSRKQGRSLWNGSLLLLARISIDQHYVLI